MWHDVAVHMSQEPWASSAVSVCVHPTGPFFAPDVVSSSSEEAPVLFSIKYLHFNKFFETDQSFRSIRISLSFSRMNWV